MKLRQTVSSFLFSFFFLFFFIFEISLFDRARSGSIQPSRVRTDVEDSVIIEDMYFKLIRSHLFKICYIELILHELFSLTRMWRPDAEVVIF